ncbi:MAG TPA: biosynthetic arginine decarboxylase [Kofleriaceae bacterium]|nr:biosynthetic arginine decarboxylase [Kofleriaceae bacterium]
MARAKPRTDPLHRWSIQDSVETYGIARWGGGYFSVSDAGNLVVMPSGDPQRTIDLKHLVDDISRRGIDLPLLLRFSDVLRSRIELINHAFENAIAECNYKGGYRGVYPIKVNQSRRIVEEVVEFGAPYHYGLEAGSKPELLAIMAMHRDDDALVVCNGYKDREYIKTALLASRLGRTVILVVEKPSELDLIHNIAGEMGIKPTLGMRARLSARGSGRWEQSGGDKSKFGLSAAEMMAAVKKLTDWGEADCLTLLHFHLGSQISAIRSIKNALREAARFYVELRKLGCSGLRYFDVGGGLGVDYDGSQTNFASSMNYSVQEYANDVVFEIQQLCDADGIEHPTLVSESGRAVAAHCSVLVVNVLGVSTAQSFTPPSELPEDAEPIAKNLLDTLQSVSAKNVLEAYHDAVEYRDQALSSFNLGHLSLEVRVLCEQLFWSISKKILGITRTLPHVPEDLEGLERTLSDTYFCNFSMFQSLPDAWAVDQLFPIAPIHRLAEQPTRRGVLADITCDSDGKIDAFIDPRDVKKVLELHDKHPDGDYLLGIFLVGAYQEILGDLHNLFGDTNAVHVSLSPDGGYFIEEVVAGDTVAEVLRYVDYAPEELVKRLRQNVEAALRKDRLTLDEARQLMNSYRDGLSSYTYLLKD